ncbi:hypothetical protein diail_9067 [Diaporthe ilicicola]|nr:hypothetical protein diail_9067 [Diaporthe ilicicola]
MGLRLKSRGWAKKKSGKLVDDAGDQYSLVTINRRQSALMVDLQENEMQKVAQSWLPLLFIPTNASPAFIFLFFVCTYFLNRPCIYCSFLLLILFMTSCNWSDRCFFDFSSNWFQPRPGVSYFTDGTASFTCAEAGGCGEGSGSGAAALSAVENMTATANATYLVAKDTVNATANAMMGAAAEHVAQARSEWTGIGIEWLRTLLGKREWRIECLDVYIRL